MQLDLQPADISWKQYGSRQTKPPFSVLLKDLVIVDMVRAKFTRGNAALEQNIHLLERTSFCLCQTEPTPDNCDRVHTCPEECLCTQEISSYAAKKQNERGSRQRENMDEITYCLPLCIPRRWTHKVRLQDTANEIRKIIRTPS